jgi:hypothetical protein
MSNAQDFGTTPFESTTRLTHQRPPLSQRGRFLKGHRTQGFEPSSINLATNQFMIRK